MLEFQREIDLRVDDAVASLSDAEAERDHYLAEIMIGELESLLRTANLHGLTAARAASALAQRGRVVGAGEKLGVAEHGGRRITRTEHDGSLTVLADRFDGALLNSPNDIVCQRDGTVWFTDPPFGILGWWEGEPAAPELPHGVYRIDSANGELACVLSDLAGPNGLAFSPDEHVLYLVESRAQPSRKVWAYDVGADGALTHKRLHIDADGAGALDGIAIDADGNTWCGWGSDGRPGASSEALDGVRVFNRDGHPIGHIHLPERCANLCFGGARRNRLFMAASHSLYALHVNVQGAL